MGVGVGVGVGTVDGCTVIDLLCISSPPEVHWGTEAIAGLIASKREGARVKLSSAFCAGMKGWRRSGRRAESKSRAQEDTKD